MKSLTIVRYAKRIPSSAAADDSQGRRVIAVVQSALQSIQLPVDFVAGVHDLLFPLFMLVPVVQAVFRRPRGLRNSRPVSGNGGYGHYQNLWSVVVGRGSDDAASSTSQDVGFLLRKAS